MTFQQSLRYALDFEEIDMLFDLDLEEQQLRVAARRVAANRKLEDVDYWRKRSGWYDDDVSMQEYNSGVYNSYYAIDDDFAEGGNSSSGGGGMGLDSDILSTALQIGGAFVGVVVLVMLVRAITRGSARRKGKNKSADGERSTARSKRSSSRRRGTSRSRSKSRTRSRSRRARDPSGVAGAGDANYELMEENKSQSSRPRSRSKARSRSKSRSRPSSRREEMLV